MSSKVDLGDEISVDIYAKFFHGLANPTRLKIVQSLLDKEKNVSELVDELQMKQSQISNQLACLKWCGFVGTRQEGKYVYYQIKDSRVKEILRLGAGIVAENASRINECTRM